MNSLSSELLGQELLNESLKVSTDASELAREINYLPGLALALKNMGLVNYYQGNFMAVLDNWTKSLETFRLIPDALGIANLNNNLGAVFYSQGSNVKALEYYLESLSVSEKLGDPLRITTVLGNIGGLYGKMNAYEKALEYYNRIEPYLEQVNDPQVTSSYLMGIGEIYFSKGEYSEAQEYFQNALPLNTNTPYYVYTLHMLGKVEFMLKNENKAIEYLNKAYKTAYENKFQADLIQTAIILGDVYQNRDLDKAIDLKKEAETLALEIGSEPDLRDIYESMSTLYAMKGDYEKAFLYQRKYLAKKDSLFNEETANKIRGLQFDFDLEKKQDEIGLLQKEAIIMQEREKRQSNFLYASIITAVLLLLLAGASFNRYIYVKRTNHIIKEQTTRSENLLLNILPRETAYELKQNGKVAAKKFDQVSVMFTDFKGFTQFSEDLSPEQLVKNVDYYFSKFDAVMTKYGLEKIKTIGDAYMCAGGLPFPSEKHPVKMIQAAFEIVEIMEEVIGAEHHHIIPFEIRIGINTGPVVAGVVGTKKFAYDIWGDTVNVASRMESLSEPGKINISESTYELVKDFFDCSFRGQIHVKNKGMMNMYFVNNFKEKANDMVIQDEADLGDVYN
jgi:class 3 adenylate cyclase/TPR repeat protein